MAGFKDITGQRFGRWSVISRTPNKGIRTQWLCRCDCGEQRIVDSNNLRTGLSRSCGCLTIETTITRCTKHGLAGTKEYAAWLDAQRRCFNPDTPNFNNYGGRGITMSPEWINSCEQFLTDMGPCPPGLSLDRIDNNGPYSKDNCRWADQKTQLNNRRNNVHLTHNGETLSLQEWAKRTGIPYSVLYGRLYHRRSVPLFATVKQYRPRRKADTRDPGQSGATGNS